MAKFEGVLFVYDLIARGNAITAAQKAKEQGNILDYRIEETKTTGKIIASFDFGSTTVVEGLNIHTGKFCLPDGSILPTTNERIFQKQDKFEDMLIESNRRLREADRAEMLPQKKDVDISEHTERDTHFSGFAKKVLEDLDEASSAFQSTLGEVTNKMVFDKFILVIAQNAYDLAAHTIDHAVDNGGIYYLRHVDTIPDLPDPDEHHDVHCNCSTCALPGRNSPGMIYSPDGFWLGDQ